MDVDPTPVTQNQETTAVKPRFLVVKRKEGDLANVNPILINKTLYGLVGQLEVVKKIKDGLLIQTRTAAQAEKLLNTSRLANMDVEITAHRYLNFSKGVVYCRDLLNCSTDDLLNELTGEGVTEIKRISVKRDGELVETGTHILTFNKPVLPKRIKVAFYSLVVRPFIPAPLRCFRCQKFGHTSKYCNKEQLCICGNPPHEGSPCNSPASCIHCNGPHSARYKKCPVFIQEMEIQELKIKEKLSYIEAKKKVLEKTPVAGVSYAQAVSSKTKPTETSDLIKELIPQLVPVIAEIISKQLTDVVEKLIPKVNVPNNVIDQIFEIPEIPESLHDSFGDKPPTEYIAISPVISSPYTPEVVPEKELPVKRRNRTPCQSLEDSESSETKSPCRRKKKGRSKQKSK